MNNGRYLYLLDLGDDEHIKYGIGTDFGRIQQHLRTYPEINLDKSYVINAPKSRTITMLEQEIGHIFGMSKKDLPEHFHGKDGHTEITKKEKLNEILEYIGLKQKYDVLGITYKVGVERPAKKVVTDKSNTVPKKTTKHSDIEQNNQFESVLIEDYDSLTKLIDDFKIHKTNKRDYFIQGDPDAINHFLGLMLSGIKFKIYNKQGRATSGFFQLGSISSEGSCLKLNLQKGLNYIKEEIHNFGDIDDGFFRKNLQMLDKLIVKLDEVSHH